jgi:Bacterial pre-peptidase C-terminal domain
MKTTRILLLSLAILLLAVPVFAGGPLANCNSNQPYRWAAGGANIPFNPDQGDLGPLGHLAAVAAVQASFNVWGAVPTSTVTYTNAGELPVDVTIANFLPFYDAPAPDGLSAIVFDDDGQIFDLLFGPGSGILGFAGPEWGTPSTCTITEGLAFLNGPAFTDLTYASDVMVHEFGHYTNLAHTLVNGQIYLGSVGGDTTGPTPTNPYAAPNPLLNDIVETMYPFYYGPGIGTSSLEADDVASVSSLYPDAGFAALGKISGSVRASDGTTRLSGVNVIARNEANPFHDAVSAVSGDWTDGVAQTDPVVGTYTLYGLTPGANYRVYVDQILAGGFSTPPISLPGPEEYYTGASESNSNVTDPPSGFTFVTPGATNVNVIFNQPAPGDPLPVGEDEFVELALPFPYKLCGTDYTSVFVNANGSLTFGSGDVDFTESVAEFLNDQPRIAGWWRDLSPFNLITGAPQGLVTFASSNNLFSVIWQNVPEYPNSGSNSFTITLKKSSDHIDVDYGSMTATSGIAGVSCGGAVTSRFETPVNLNASNGRYNLHNQPAVYEVFTPANPNDLAGNDVLYSGTTTYDDNWAEPNNTLAQARSISLPFNSIPVNRFTEIEPDGADVDFFRFTAQAGDLIIAETLTGNIDTMLVLADAGGNVIAFDDDGGAGLLSRFVAPIPATGTYYLGVTTYPDLGFTGAGVGAGRYVLSVGLAVGPQPIAPGDDGSVELPLGFTFPFQGQNWTSVFVNGNGNLTFGAPNGDFSESVAELLSGPPRIAPLWDDLNPGGGGQVTAEWSAGQLTIAFVNVPEFIATGANTFSVTLHATGQYTVSYGAVSALDALAGTSQGNGAANPGESNLSSAAVWPALGTTYELFTGAGDPFDLDNLSLNFMP